MLRVLVGSKVLARPVFEKYWVIGTVLSVESGGFLHFERRRYGKIWGSVEWYLIPPGATKNQIKALRGILC